jgi:DNA mismatch endonuclease (patch repair protein)
LRSALHARGFRFRLHRRDLPGSPDIIFVSQKVAIFVDGCFWHGCPEHGVKPKTNDRFWAEKIKENQERDRKATKELRRLGWYVLRVWEHDLKRDIPRTIRSIEKIIHCRSGDRE